MSFAYAQPSKESFVLVEFFYGDPTALTSVKYTNLEEDYIGGYVSTPSMQITLAPNTGTLDGTTFKINLPMDSFTRPLSSTLPFSATYVRIREITRAFTGGPQATDLMHLIGRVLQVTRNYNGFNDRVLIEAVAAKSLLDTPLALPCNPDCIWNLFGRGCGLNIVSYRINSVPGASWVGKTLTCSHPSVTTGHPERYWHRGYLEREGVRVGIREWVLAAPDTFHLMSQPPDSWVGQSLNFIPGCDKTIETCRSRYNNEEHFAGTGYAIPSYNPILEDPQ